MRGGKVGARREEGTEEWGGGRERRETGGKGRRRGRTGRKEVGEEATQQRARDNGQEGKAVGADADAPHTRREGTRWRSSLPIFPSPTSPGPSRA